VGLSFTAAGELILADEYFRAVGDTLVSVAVGCFLGGPSADVGAAVVGSAAVVIALDWAPPLLCASPLQGSSVAVDPIEGVPVMLVALGVVEVEVDSPTEVPPDGAESD
jgi:hypothetical protein